MGAPSASNSPSALFTSQFPHPAFLESVMATTINIWIVSIEEYLSNRPLPDCSQKHCGGNKLIANNNQRALRIFAKLMNESDLVYESLASEIFVTTPS